MRTPYGAECKFYYADFHRGRSTQQCRLPRRDPDEKWAPALCRSCPVPRLLLANACPNLFLTGKIDRGFLGLNRKMTVDAFCRKSDSPIAEPAVGCGHCHEADPELKFNLDS
jgi:hypothetical protein